MDTLLTKSEILQALSLGDCLPQVDMVKTKARLIRRVDSSFLETKPVFSKGQKSNSVKYIPWHNLLILLDYLAPYYSFKVSENQIGELFVVKASLTINCTNGDLFAENLGCEPLNTVAYGGAMPEATAQALRRSCAMLGLGRYLYYSSESQTNFRSNNEITKDEWLAKQSIRY